MGIEPLQLVHVKAGSRRIQVGTVKELHQLVQAENFLIAVGPAEADQIVYQGLGQQAVLLILDDSPCTVTLGELGAVLSQNHGHMAEDRLLQAKSAVDKNLAGRIGDMVIAPDDVGNAHFIVVHNDGHVIGGRAVGALDHHVVQFRDIHADAALDHVVKDNLSLGRAFQAHAGTFCRTMSQFAAVSVVSGL